MTSESEEAPTGAGSVPKDTGSQELDGSERAQQARANKESFNAGKPPAAADEASGADRDEQAKRILAVAAGRDDDADVRDAMADRRDEAASRTAFLSYQEDYGPALTARRSAAADRLDSKTDRASSADDRIKLTQHDHDADEASPPA